MSEYKVTKDRGLTIILALFFGGLGFHRFYLGQTGWGLLFLLFFWTFIPTFIAIIDIIRYTIITEQEFHKRYSKTISY